MENRQQDVSTHPLGAFIIELIVLVSPYIIGTIYQQVLVEPQGVSPLQE